MAEKRYFLLNKDGSGNNSAFNVVGSTMAHTHYEAGLKLGMPSNDKNLLVGPKDVWESHGSSLKPYSEKVVKLCITVSTNNVGEMLL